LFGDDASDKNLYNQLNALRVTDPVAYMDKMNSLKNQESEIANKLNRIVTAIELIKSDRLDSCPSIGNTILSPVDDPKVTCESAKREEHSFAGILASSEDIDEIEKCAGKANVLYRKTSAQVAMAQSAIKDADRMLTNVNNKLSSLSSLQNQANNRLGEAKKIHQSTDVAEKSLKNGILYCNEANSELQKAHDIIEEKRHLESTKIIGTADEHITAATNEFNHCIQICDNLDEQKRQYEAKLNSMPSRYDDAAEKIRRYGGSVNRLSPFESQGIGNVANYALLLVGLSSMESDWDSHVRSAKNDYEEEQEQIRQQAEEHRRTEEAKHRSSWDNDSSFGSSSSGSSWDSGSSFSSGGSWGGGGSSSSGGSW
jgi:chromosome segregation ATPase